MQSELPNPVNFDAATAYVTTEDMRQAFGCGPEVATHLAAAQPFVDAGYDHLALINAGTDVDGFFEHFATELAEPLRALRPSSWDRVVPSVRARACGSERGGVR